MTAPGKLTQVLTVPAADIHDQLCSGERYQLQGPSGEVEPGFPVGPYRLPRR